MNNIMKTILTGFLGVITLTWLTDAYAPVSPPPPVICPCDYKYNPVCGSDGITYTNECVLDCTSCANVEKGLPPIKVVEECECPGNCRCQDIDFPVCSLDGVTYPNECVLACDNIRRLANKQHIVYLAYRTPCRGSPGINIPTIASPVCGTDNVLYRNKYILDFVNSCNLDDDLPPITVKNVGACEGYTCPLTPQPVCANDGNIYENPCLLESENERRKKAGIPYVLSEVDPSVCRACPCPKIRKPVCGSDGNTYDNSCLLDCEREQNNPHLRQAYKGECQECNCDRKFLPVCGTDRKTYDNECLLECENIGRSEYLAPIEVFHVGECQVFLCDCSYCEETFQPMCGTDGVTYWNLCWLKCNDKCCQKNGQNAVFLSKRGRC